MAMTGGEYVLKSAAAHSIGVCFANPGTTEMALVDALDATPQVRGVLGLFEGVCTGMADGYARMTGKPALTMLHLGVGLGNGIANLHNARRAYSPIVNLVGDHPQEHLPYDAPLTSDIATMAAPVSDWVGAGGRVAALPEAFRHAADSAGQRPGGIATLILPADVMAADVGELGEPEAREVRRRPVDAGAVERVAKIVAEKRGAGLLLGGTALLRESLKQLEAVARKTGAQLLAEPFPARMDRGAGLPDLIRLPYFPEAVLERLQGFDTLVLVGAKPPVSFFKYPGYPSSLVPESCRVETLCAPDEDAAAYAAALAEALGAAGGNGGSTGPERPDAPSGALTTKSLGQAVAAALPEHAIIADESATSGGPAYHLTKQGPAHSAMYLTGGGIGMGLPAATGAAVACPDRPVLALQADGGGMYTLQALWTQAREGLNVTNVILVNRKYQILQVEHGRASQSGMGETARGLTELRDPELDWCALAQGMGVAPRRPQSAEGLHTALKNSLEEPGPSLIEVVLE